MTNNTLTTSLFYCVVEHACKIFTLVHKELQPALEEIRQGLLLLLFRWLDQTEALQHLVQGLRAVDSVRESRCDCSQYNKDRYYSYK